MAYGSSQWRAVHSIRQFPKGWSLATSRNQPHLPSRPKPKLFNQVRQAIRTRHYSPRTEETYVHWIKRFIRRCFAASRPLTSWSSWWILQPIRIWLVDPC
ncbi:MAG: phage integrase N-terminal SAM-like domain-containing protein [Candidatus Binatia bacterium]|nr:phage integrase N-terminal SAM-like domain-containing protein [Candidatus Binatia bacterium]